MKAGDRVCLMIGWLAVLMGVSLDVRGQGSLTPPGAPAPTMKTLSQVEPRTPITNLPFTITQGGSYYLVTNLSTTGDGIVISTNGVTVDLMGFTVSGDRGTGDYGVWMSSGIKGVSVQNGSVGGFEHGVYLSYSSGCRLDGLRVWSNKTTGVYLNGMSAPCNGNSIINCAVIGNDATGIELLGDPGVCSGNMILNCTITDNGDRALYLYRVDNNTVANCTITGNRGDGIYFAGGFAHCDGNSIQNCNIGGNTGDGIAFDGLNGQCNGNTIADCTIVSNGSCGINLYANDGIASGQADGNVIRDCTFSANADTAIYLYYADRNRVERNHCVGPTGGTTYGVRSKSGAGNVVVQNTCMGHSTNFVLTANDTYGPIVTNTGPLASSGDSAHPWANFSR